MQAAVTKNVKLLPTPNASPPKQSSLPTPPGVTPPNSTVLPSPQNTQNQYLPLPPTPPKILLQQPSLKRPPLPLTRPPLPTVPPPPLPPTLPPPPPAPNQILMSQSVAQLPPPPMSQITPTGFPPMYPYTPLPNTTQSFTNSMFSQPPNLIPAPVSVQFRPHEAIPREMGVQFMGESVPPRASYGENYNQRENMQQPQSSQSFGDFEMQDSYEENRQKFNENRAFSREGAFVGGNYGNGSQHFVDGQHYSESGQHYVDGGGGGGSQHYSDPTYQSGLPFRATALNKRGFNSRSSLPLPPPPQYQQNRQVRNHPYQRR